MDAGPRALRRPALLLLAGLATSLPVAAQTLVDVFPDTFDQPTPMVTDSLGNVYVAGELSHNVWRIAPDGTTSVAISRSAPAPGPCAKPFALAIGPADELYVACDLNDKVLRLDTDGTLSEALAPAIPGSGDVELTSLAVSAGGTLFVGATVDGDGFVFEVAPGGTVSIALDETSVPGGLPGQPLVFGERGTVIIGWYDHLWQIDGTGAPLLLADGIGTAVDVAVTTGGAIYACATNTLYRVTLQGAVDVLESSKKGMEVEADELGNAWVIKPVDGPFGLQSEIRRIDPSGQQTVVVPVTPPEGVYYGLAAGPDNSIYWLLDLGSMVPGSHWLARRAPGGAVSLLIDAAGAGPNEWAVDAHRPFPRADGSVLVASEKTDNILVADGSGGVASVFTIPDFRDNVRATPTFDAQGRPLVVTGGSTFANVFDAADVLRLEGLPADVTKVYDGGAPGAAGQGQLILAAAPDSRGDTWFLTEWYLFRVAPDGTVTQVYEPGNLGDYTHMVLDSRDTVYVSGADDAIHRITPDGVGEVLVADLGDTVQELAVDAQDNVLARVSSQVLRIAPDGEVTPALDSSMGVTLGPTTAMAVGRQGDIWLAVAPTTFSPLVVPRVVHRAPDGTVEVALDAADLGLDDLFVGAMVADPFGDLYVLERRAALVVRLDAAGGATVLVSNADEGTAALASLPQHGAIDLSGTLWFDGGAAFLALSQDDWWTDLHGSAPGLAGRPRLAVRATMEPGSSFDRVITHAPPNALMLNWIAFQSTPFDAIGGTVHAFPYSQQLAFVADAQGDSGFALTWPAGIPSGIDVYLQFIVQDLSVPDGLTLSNAVTKTTP